MRLLKSWLLVVASLALSGPGLEATKVKVMMTPPPAAAEELDAAQAPLTRSIPTPATTQIQPAVAPLPAPVPLTFNKIVQKQGLAGSSVYMAPTAPANPFGHSIIQVVPVYQPLTGTYDLSISSVVKEFAASLNGAKSPEVLPAGVTYTNPLYNVRVPHLATMGDHVVATRGNEVFLLKNGNPDALVSTADLDVALLRPAAVRLTPLQDAAGAPVGNPIVALATSQDKIFAAVPTTGIGFNPDSDDRGVAVLGLVGDTLVQAAHAQSLSFNAINGAAGAGIPAATSFTEGAPSVIGAAVAVDAPIVSATLNRVPVGQHGSGVVMHYSPELDRVFVGFKNLRKRGAVAGQNISNVGGLMGIVVGRPYVVGVAPALDFRSLLYAPSEAAMHTPGLAGVATQNLANKIFTVFHGAGLGNPAAGLVAGQLRADRDPSVTVEHLKTMRTSTGRDYLIVASSIKVAPAGFAGAATELAGVYFMPIMGKKNSAAPALPALPETVGRLASPDFASVLSGLNAAVAAAANPRIEAAAASLAQLPTHQANAIFEARNVGLRDVAGAVADPLIGEIENINQINDLQVVGDTVLITFDRSVVARDNKYFGVYQSTAIFDNAGKITRWTPLERMSGAAQQAQAAAVDAVSGNLMYLTDGGRIFNISDWGRNSDATQDLQKLIAQHFPADKGGVRSIQTFDDATPSFDQRDVAADGALSRKKTALTVVLGDEKVMVVQTLHSNRPAIHFYDQGSAAAKIAAIAAMAGPLRVAATAAATTFAEALPAAPAAVVPNVFVFEGPDLKRIAPLTCAEVLRINVAAGAASTLGHIYVGGYRGVCRLEGPLGIGWETASAALALTGLTDFAAHFAAPATFVRCNNPALKEVVKIVSTPCRGANARARLAVVMNDRVVHVDATAGGLPGSLNLTAVNNIDFAADAPIFDALVLRDRTAAAANDHAMLILATASGLIVRELHGLNSHRIPSLVPGDVPLQLAYVPRERGGVVGGAARVAGGAGMLYVLAGNQAMGTVKLYRSEVRWDAAPANVLVQIVGDAEPITFETFRRYFATDGYRFFMGHDIALDTPEMLVMRTMSNPKTASFPLTWALSNGRFGDFARPGVRDAVTGAWMVAGSFGLKVND